MKQKIWSLNRQLAGEEKWNGRGATDRLGFSQLQICHDAARRVDELAGIDAAGPPGRRHG